MTNNMGLIVGILLEVMFLEILILILLSVFSSKPKKEKKVSEFQVIEIKKELKRNFSEPKKEEFQKTKNKKILKKKIGEFERFLSLLIPLTIIAYLLVSNYTGIHFNLLTIVLLAAGIILISIFIFFESTKKYR